MYLNLKVVWIFQMKKSCKKKYNNNVKVHNKQVYVDFKYNKFQDKGGNNVLKKIRITRF